MKRNASHCLLVVLAALAFMPVISHSQNVAEQHVEKLFGDVELKMRNLKTEEPAEVLPLPPSAFIEAEGNPKAIKYISENPNSFFDKTENADDEKGRPSADEILGTDDAVGALNSKHRSCVLNIAKQAAMTEAKYVWGATGENNTFDCSGLIHHALRQCGASPLPDRITTSNIVSELKIEDKIVDCAKALPSDFILWPKNQNGIGHIGFVSHQSGGTNTIEASGSKVQYKKLRERSNKAPKCYTNPFG